MAFEFLKKVTGGKGFGVEVRVDGHLAGEADFFEEPGERGVYGARVDVKPKFRQKGLATLALQTGDMILKSEKPGARRRFHDINSLSYKKYTKGISDEQIELIDKKGIVFKP